MKFITRMCSYHRLLSRASHNWTRMGTCILCGDRASRCRLLEHAVAYDAQSPQRSITFMTLFTYAVVMDNDTVDNITILLQRQTRQDQVTPNDH